MRAQSLVESHHLGLHIRRRLRADADQATAGMGLERRGGGLDPGELTRTQSRLIGDVVPQAPGSRPASGQAAATALSPIDASRPPRSGLECSRRQTTTPRPALAPLAVDARPSPVATASAAAHCPADHAPGRPAPRRFADDAGPAEAGRTPAHCCAKLRSRRTVRRDTSAPRASVDAMPRVAAPRSVNCSRRRRCAGLCLWAASSVSRCLASAPRTWSQLVSRPLKRGAWERSGSYNCRIAAWVNASHAPPDIGCCGLPSSLIGRPATVLPSTGCAMPQNGMAVAYQLNAGRQLRRLPDGGHGLLRGFATRRETRHGQGGRHQLQKTPTIHLQCGTGKLRLDQRLRLGRCRQRFEPAPVRSPLSPARCFAQCGEVHRAGAHRWQIPQSVKPRGSICRSFIKRSPSADDLRRCAIAAA
jgi:hypothetical protein